MCGEECEELYVCRTPHFEARKPREQFEFLENELDVDTSGARGFAIIVADDTEGIARVEYWSFPVSSAGYIQWVFVEESYRRKGIASKIRRTALNHLASIGIDTVYTGPLSEEGRSLAESQGFVPVEQVEGWYVSEIV